MIEFKWEEFLDEDRSWSALFVKTDDKDWHMADPNYGTEDEKEIRMIIRNTKFCNTILDSFITFIKTEGTELTYKTPKYLHDWDAPWGVDFGGVTLFTDKDFNEFEVGYESYDSGSYWEPPSTDYLEHSKHKSLTDALFAAYGVLLKDEYHRWNEASMDRAFRYETEKLEY
jgi:hypothetical protein